MAQIDYKAIMDAIQTKGQTVLSSYGWHRDRFDMSAGNLPQAVNVAIAFGGIRPYDMTTGGRSRVLTVLLGIVVRGKDFSAAEEALTDAIAALEYQLQPPILTVPFFALSPALIVDVTFEATREGPDRALGRLNLTLYNEG
jgi:hypothetical protein